MAHRFNMLQRRAFLTGLAAAVVVAPSIVRATSIMPVRKLATVDASYQTGSAIVINPLARALNVGDIITIDGVDAWSRTTNESTAAPRQFVVTAQAEGGFTHIQIYPPIIGEHEPRYRTVDKLPMNRAEVRLVDLFGY